MDTTRQWSFGGGALLLMEGDLTHAEVDAVVNAANSRLAGGGGVDGAIHDAAGHDALQAACREIIARIGSLEPGEAVITPGFALPADHIIHTVGPIWRGGGSGEAATLARAYRSCLELARERGIGSIAFPAVSCGVYGFPVELAAPIALAQLRRGLQDGLVREARMVLHGEAGLRVWLEASDKLFPLGRP
ncbi:MAG: macro domain-containing protein [Desulfovibrionaceae bacterium]